MNVLDKLNLKADSPRYTLRGKRPRKNRKWECTDATSCFNFTPLLHKIREDIKKEFKSISIEEKVAKTEESLKSFSINNQVFEYLKQPATLGGVRWYILCPKCKRPVLKLYLPTTADREPFYFCRSCHSLKPSSLIYEHNNRYQSITRPLKRMDLIRRKLLKKNIDMNEAKNLLEEYEQLEKMLYDTPEYKLWIFKKEHSKNT
jgi:hypothetical protein